MTLSTNSPAPSQQRSASGAVPRAHTGLDAAGNRRWVAEPRTSGMPQLQVEAQALPLASRGGEERVAERADKALPPAIRSTAVEHEMARVEAATVSTSLSPESARQVRIDRVVASQANLVEQARKRGFYDFMLGRQSDAQAQGKKLEVSYEQGWVMGMRHRAVLKGRAWYETEKLREGGKWTWRVYREGYFQAQGTAPNESRADQDIEVAKADLMDRNGDWPVRELALPVHEEQEEDEVPTQRM